MGTMPRYSCVPASVSVSVRFFLFGGGVAVGVRNESSGGCWQGRASVIAIHLPTAGQSPLQPVPPPPPASLSPLPLSLEPLPYQASRNNIMYNGKLEVMFPAANVVVLMRQVEGAGRVQRFYREHTDNVMCFRMHGNGRICASGQVCTYCCLCMMFPGRVVCALISVHCKAPACLVCALCVVRCGGVFFARLGALPSCLCGTHRRWSR
jgi:hypothetical protein